MRWIEIKVESDPKAEEIISSVVHDVCRAPSPTDGGVSIYDNGATIKAWIPVDDRAETTVLTLRSRLDDLDLDLLGITRPDLILTPVQDDDWALNYRNFFTSFQCGRFWIHPPWEDASSNPEPAVLLPLTIDPGMAFGTGYHPTTQLMLEILSESNIEGKRILDMGAGSAILSIAAAKLGAGHIDAVEIDPVAEENALLNIQLNGVTDRVRFIVADAPPPDAGSYDFVVMNIIADIIKLLTPTVYAAMKPGATLACSGIIDDRVEEVQDHLIQAGFKTPQIRESAEWRAVICQKD